MLGSTIPHQAMLAVNCRIITSYNACILSLISHTLLQLFSVFVICIVLCNPQAYLKQEATLNLVTECVL